MSAYITLNDGDQKQALIPFSFRKPEIAQLNDRENQAILIFDSNPSAAEVWINDQKVGETPYQGLHHKKKDKLKVTLKEASHRPLSFEVELYEPITELERFELEKGQAKVLVFTEPFQPGAKVFVDGANQGEAPVSLLLASGYHSIQVMHQDEKVLKTVQLRDGEDKEIVFSFSGHQKSELTPESTLISESSEVQLLIDSYPTNANVLINGRVVGKTPYQGSGFEIGDSVNIELFLDGYEKINITTYPLESEREDFGVLLLKAKPELEKARLASEQERKRVGKENDKERLKQITYKDCLANPDWYSSQSGFLSAFQSDESMCTDYIEQMD